MVYYLKGVEDDDACNPFNNNKSQTKGEFGTAPWMVFALHRPNTCSGAIQSEPAYFLAHVKN